MIAANVIASNVETTPVVNLTVVPLLVPEWRHVGRTDLSPSMTFVGEPTTVPQVPLVEPQEPRSRYGRDAAEFRGNPGRNITVA